VNAQGTTSNAFSAPWSQSSGSPTLPLLAAGDFTLNVENNQGSGFSATFASQQGAYPIMSLTDAGLINGHPTVS
jgi:hypothetical protein